MTGGATGRILVTGGAGFIGSNLADRLARDGHEVVVFDALARPGVRAEPRLARPPPRRPHPSRHRRHPRCRGGARTAADGADAVFHLAAQVAVTTSLSDPVEDFDINVRGTLNLLEALRRRGRRTPLIFASTNKVYGDLADVALELTDEGYLPRRRRTLRRHGIDETRPARLPHPLWLLQGRRRPIRARLRPQLRRADLRPAHELHLRSAPDGHRGSGLGRALPDPGARMASRSPSTATAVRCATSSHVGDAVQAYVAAWRNIDAVKGRAFNLGGGSRQRRQPAAADRRDRAPDRQTGGPGLRRLARRRPALVRRRCRRPARALGPAGARCLARRRRRARGAGSGTSAPTRRGAADALRVARMKVALRQSAPGLRQQHLFRLPRAASAARTRLQRGAAARPPGTRRCCWTAP